MECKANRTRYLHWRYKEKWQDNDMNLDGAASRKGRTCTLNENSGISLDVNVDHDCVLGTRLDQFQLHF